MLQQCPDMGTRYRKPPFSFTKYWDESKHGPVPIGLFEPDDNNNNVDTDDDDESNNNDEKDDNIVYDKENDTAKDRQMDQTVDIGSEDNTDEETGNLVGPLKFGRLDAATLHQTRCRQCQMCKREPCKSCANCKWNDRHSTRRPHACLRNMCAMIPEDDKIQKAVGFPAGWGFYYRPDDNYNPVRRPLGGLVYVHPDGARFRRLDDAEGLFGGRPTITAEQKCIFMKHVGATTRIALAEHPLLGRPCYHQWVRRHGETVGIYGVVGNVEKDVMLKRLYFTVVFDEDSRSLLTRSDQEWPEFPTSMELDEDSALFGCKKWEENTGLVTSWSSTTEDQFLVKWKWIAPNIARRDMVQTFDLVRPGFDVLPRVQIQHKGYVLTFTAERSDIYPGDLGVFLSIKRCHDRVPIIFILEAGQGLEFDVCGPFRPADCPRYNVRVVKALIHKFSNWKYCRLSGKDEYDTEEDYYLDLTDDNNGDIHAVAREHVAPFVNFVVEEDTVFPTVYCRKDLEGSIHYCLGNDKKEDGPFRFPADGTEHKIAIELDERNINEVSMLIL